MTSTAVPRTWFNTIYGLSRCTPMFQGRLAKWEGGIPYPGEAREGRAGISTGWGKRNGDHH